MLENNGNVRSLWLSAPPVSKKIYDKSEVSNYQNSSQNNEYEAYRLACGILTLMKVLTNDCKYDGEEEKDEYNRNFAKVAHRFVIYDL